MRIAISGSSGLIGSALVKEFTAQGHSVIRLVRNKTKITEQEIFFDLENGLVEQEKLENLAAVIHLAGEGIANKTWSKKQKEKLALSRILGTRTLIGAINNLKYPPQLVITASAIGYYGNRDEEELDESSSKGLGFLAELAQNWENEANNLNKNIRLINLRFGLVLSKKGGALKKMLLPFKFGLGGKLGSGKQYMSWVAIEDVVSAFSFFLENKSISGPVNLVSPNPVTNAIFTKNLANALKRPSFFHVPAWALKLFLGEMADELLLSSQRVVPKKLLNAGFKFKHDLLDRYLKQTVG